MSAELQSTAAASQLHRLLAGLRMRIRAYIWAEGLAMIVVALGLAFWATLAFDWLFEPPWQFRAVMLVLVGVSVAYVAYRYLMLRAFRPLDDTSMAVLLERRYADYHDSLLTTVELGMQPAHAAAFNREMLAHTRDSALARSQNVELGDVLRYGELLRTLGLAAALAVSVLALVVFAPKAFGTWRDRVLMLDPDLIWPRSNHVRVQGFADDRRIKVAKGSDLEIVAIADLRPPYAQPESVEIRYWTDEGTRGRDNMASVGAVGPRDAEQKFAYTFKGIMSSIDFDVYGGDDRDRGFRIDVVENPTLSKMQLACVYPEYTGRVSNVLPAAGTVPLPMGTKVSIHCEANKPLAKVGLTMLRAEKPVALPDVEQFDSDDNRTFTVDLPEVTEETALLFDLHDADGIRGRQPVRLTLAMIPDEAPLVGLRLSGISTAITPQARLPVAGQVRDDYGVARLWYEYQVGKEGEPQQYPLAMPAASRPPLKVAYPAGGDEALDLKALADLAELLKRRNVKTLDDLSSIGPPEGQRLASAVASQAQLDALLAFQPQAGQQFFLTLAAADNSELAAGANVGQGERYQLDIVAPEQLLSMLEGRELMLRRRFEIIYQELQDTRDGLARTDFTPVAEREASNRGREPGDEPGESETGDEAKSDETPQERTARLEAREKELRDLRVTRAADNSERSAHETLSVAEGFDEIREEMINNRLGLDTPEVHIRLKDQIAEPLRQISQEMFPRLKARLQELRKNTDNPATGEAALKASLAETDAILVAMKQVLDKMLELESYNEVIEAMRKIIATQEEIARKTLEKQKEVLKDKLRDLELDE